MIDIKTKTKTIVRDRGAKNLFRQLESLDGKTITAGIQSPWGSELPIFRGKVDGKVPIAQYAFWQEYGTKNIPARPFLRLTMETKKSKFQKDTATIMRKLSKGGKIDNLLLLQSAEISKWIKGTIHTLRTPPNSPSTLRWKKRLGRGSNPLIFSGTMKKAVTSTVRDSKVPGSRKLRRMINKINKEMMGLTP